MAVSQSPAGRRTLLRARRGGKAFLGTTGEKKCENEGLMPKRESKDKMGCTYNPYSSSRCPRERRGSTATAAGPAQRWANAAGCRKLGGANARGRDCRLRAELSAFNWRHGRPILRSRRVSGLLEPPVVFSVYSTRSTSLQSIDLLIL